MLDVQDPALPWRRKTPRHFDEGNAPAEYSSSSKDMYRQMYYEALDLAMSSFYQRFNQPGFRACSNVEQLFSRLAIVTNTRGSWMLCFHSTRRTCIDQTVNTARELQDSLWETSRKRWQTFNCLPTWDSLHPWPSTEVLNWYGLSCLPTADHYVSI